MSEFLPQTEANEYFIMAKHYRGTQEFDYPGLGGVRSIPLESDDGREKFLLDITRQGVQLAKNTFQCRVRKVFILARLDIGGPPHRNPDGKEVPCPHLHLYREGYGDKWAGPLPEVFSNPSDAWRTLDEFIQYCNIITRPVIYKDLFT